MQKEKEEEERARIAETHVYQFHSTTKREEGTA